MSTFGRPALFTLGGLLAIGGASLLDAWCWRTCGFLPQSSSDLLRLLRVCGYLPTALLMALALVLVDWRRRKACGFLAAVRRGMLLTVSSVAATVVAEILKWAIGRQRPGDLDPEYVFRAFAERGWSTEDLGIPSSHVTVAFGTMVMLCFLFPRATPVFLFLAAGCAWTRLLRHSHYLSDVTAGAVVGSAVAWLVWRWMTRLGTGGPASESS